MGFSELMARADVAVRGHLGGTVTYAPSSGDPVEVQGIFDAAYVLVEGSGPVRVSSSGPAVFLTLSDLPSDPSADNATVTVDGTTYRTREAKPDGFGGVLILLHEV